MGAISEERDRREQGRRHSNGYGKEKLNITFFLSYLESACLSIHPSDIRVEGTNWEERKDQWEGAVVAMEGNGDRYEQSKRQS